MEDRAFAAGLSEELQRPPGGLGLAPIVDRDRETGPSQSEGERTPQSPPGASHESHLHGPSFAFRAPGKAMPCL